jgi:hypothetical protein
MRWFRFGAAAVVWGVGLEGVAFAQPQDDAALADVPDEKPSRNGSLALAPGFKQQSSAVAAQQDAEPQPAMTTEELRRAHPDLELRVMPPPTLTVFLTGMYPFQSLGFGLGLDMYALPRLRLSAIGTAGIVGAVNDELRVSLYAEAGVGFVVLRWPGQATAELPSLATRSFHSSRTAFDRFMLGDEAPPARLYAHALVPSSHSLELAGGLFTGTYPLYRCTEHCNEDPGVAPHTNEDASSQVTLLYAGVRYVYYRWARSAQVPFRSLAGFEAGIDAIANPFTPADTNLFNLYDHHPSHHPVGARVKLHIRGLKCALSGPCLGLNLMGGYLPSPSDALFSINLELQ